MVCGLSLVAASGGFFFAVASLAVEHSFWDVSIQELRLMGLITLWHVGSSQARG